MSRYRRVETAMWRDEGFLSLSPAPPSGQTLWLYLLTGPRTLIIPGVVVAREAVMADDLGWSKDALSQRMAESTSKGLVVFDQRSGLAILRKALIHRIGGVDGVRETNRPATPNVLHGWAKSWEEIPECDLKIELLRDLESFSEMLGPSFHEAFTKGWAKPLAKAGASLCLLRNQGSGIRNQEGRMESAREISDPISDRIDLPVAPEKKASKPAKPKRTKLPLPENFTPDETAIAIAAELQIDPASELLKFRDHAAANARLAADWQAAFRTWVRKGAEFRGNGRPGASQRPLTEGKSASQLVLERLMAEEAAALAATNEGTDLPDVEF